MSSSLSSAIKFCSLSEELNDAEFGRLLSAICARAGRKLIVAALFEQLRHEDNVNAAESAIGAIHDIMNAREKTHEIAQPQTVGMHALPSELIGEVGSYLNYIDYFDFGEVCRATYTGCNTPCTLRNLDVVDYEDYSPICLQKFPQIRSLHIDLNLFDQFQLPQTSAVCTHLKKVRLFGDNENDCDINLFMSSNAIDFSSVTHLTLTSFGNGDDDENFSIETLLRLLSKFEGNLQFIDFCNVFVPAMDAAQRARLVELFPNLIGVQMTGGSGFGVRLIESFAPNWGPCAFVRWQELRAIPFGCYAQFCQRYSTNLAGMQLGCSVPELRSGIL